MELDNKKILLLRSYSRTSLSTGNGCSASGLEKILPRTSTPNPDRLLSPDDKDAFDPYEIFRALLQSAPRKVAVRGVKNVPYDFISGHLVQSKTKGNWEDLSFSLNLTHDNREKSKFRYDYFKKTVKRFFRKLCKNFVRSKCDYAACPITCECRRIRSFLNKTLVDGE